MMSEQEHKISCVDFTSVVKTVLLTAVKKITEISYFMSIIINIKN